MNSRLALLVAVSLGFVLSSCTTKPVEKSTSVVKEPVKVTSTAGTNTAVKTEPVKTSVDPVVYYTKQSPSRITLNVTSTSDKQFDTIVRGVEGAIANSGFEVSADNPFFTVSVAGKLDKFDKFGNFYVYDSSSELSVQKNKPVEGKNPLLARISLKATGERKLGEDDAKSSAIGKLSESSSKWVKEVLDRELVEVEAVKAELPLEVFEKVFGPNRNNIQKNIDELLVRAGKLEGVLSCTLISMDAKKVIIEVVYRKKNFPNGIIYEKLSADINLKDSKDPVGDFLKCVFKVH